MTINFKNKTIELSKNEMKAASVYGSEAYKDLQNAKCDNPGFKVVTTKTKKSTADFANLNKATIKRYVEAHGSDEQKEAYETLSAKRVDEETGEILPPESFFNLKRWFLKEFEENLNDAKAIREKRQAILAKIA